MEEEWCLPFILPLMRERSGHYMPGCRMRWNGGGSCWRHRRRHSTAADALCYYPPCLLARHRGMYACCAEPGLPLLSLSTTAACVAPWWQHDILNSLLSPAWRGAALATYPVGVLKQRA